MLDRCLEVKIDEFRRLENLEERKLIYRGQIININNTNDKTSKNNNYSANEVFVIATRYNLKEIMTSKVTAIAYIKNKKDPVLIVAPRNYICYEPEITLRLKSVFHDNILKIVCLNEKSCGAIIFFGPKATRKTLLIKNKRSKNWSFPKGHIELKETEKETAIREVFEETGLHAEIINGFRETASYWLSGKIKKTVVLFAAKVKTTKVRMQKEEVKNFKWTTYKKTLESLRHINDLRIFKKAKKFIDNIDNINH
ncbi:MAG: NUDIX domain-containing protein [Oscillospiraceae bacterium]|jgi:8-oxo-dGTP pyrophosphatase MutT (NUDIX family)|nr:NUDIX domain-containing protein [Oscillospiraceae bacterium]